MKDNRKTPFISDLSKSVQTSQGTKKFPVASHVRFNNFSDTGSSAGTLVKDSVTASQYEIVEGVPSSGGLMTESSATLTDFSGSYGLTAYTSVTLYDNIGAILPMKQRGLRFPLEGTASGATGRKLAIKRNVQDLNPSIDGRELCFMLNIKVGSNHNNQSILMIGEPGTAKTTFSIGFTGLTNLELKHRAGSGTSAVQTNNNFVYLGEWITLFVNTSTTKSGSTIRPSLGVHAAYSTVTGKRLFTQAGVNSIDPVISISSPNLYVGYGEPNGGVNNNFALTDFLQDVEVAELAVFNRNLSSDEMALIARSHLDENHYRSGFNNRSPRITQQIFDAKSTYPISANPALAKSTAPAFNDTTTKIFLSGSEVEDIVFPEMLPARLLSGSTDTTNGTPGAPGDTSPFYRDVHNTPYDKRLVAPGKVRSGLSHKETELLNLATRSSPVTISQDTVYLGGAVTPYDDSNPLIDEVFTTAVAADVYPGLQQRLADHVAIIIDLSPTSDSTIGVERDDAGISTGRVTSIAYFNFDTKKWETKGKNNDFIVQGPITVSTGSTVYNVEEIGEKNNYISQLAWKVFDDTSVAFAGTSGFSIFYDQGIQEGLAPLAQRGAPTSNYGFPIHQKYEAADSQLIDMSRYITAPFLLERVSFEFGAAIEDSGPHSLGYNATTLSEEFNLGQPAITAMHSLGQPSQPLYPNRVQQTRAPFINGSILHPISSYDKDLTLATHGFMSSSAADLNAIVSTADGATRFKLARKPCTLWSASAQDPYGTGLLFKSTFLKTSVGPRGYTSAQSTSQRKSGDQTDALGGGPAAIPYIPVIAGGVNGVVTGSTSAVLGSPTEGIGPHIALEYNIEHDPNFEFAGMDNRVYANEDGSKARGGTPFWRADSFFLLRQAAVKRNPIPMTYSFIPGSDAGMVPLAPYQGALQPYLRSNLGEFKKEQDRNELRNFGKIIHAEAIVTSPVAITGSTTREMITYGQMTHFGYTNAYDSVMDTILDSANEHDHMSGSHNSVFLDQIFDAGVPRPVPLFGQAIKYASYPTFSWATVPANVSQPLFRVPANDAANTSVFSDLPDSYQGQFAYFPTAQDGGNNTWNLAIEHNDPASRNRVATSTARYHASGSQDNDLDAVNDTTSPGNLAPHTAYTLDTYVGWPNVDSADALVIEGLSNLDISDDNQIAVGSGFSVISTPAYITDGPRYYAPGHPRAGKIVNPDGYRDFSAVGSFTDPNNDKNWLTRGLSRDLNINLASLSKHQGANPGFDDNWCGFTLMTASTVWRPNESPGRESASLPLQANVYKRQYLNLRKDFKISVPVRTTAPSSIEPPGYALFTAADPETNFVTSLVADADTSNRTFYEPQDNLYYSRYTGGIIQKEGNPELVAGGKGITWRTAHSAKRYHRKYAVSIAAGGFVPGADFGGVNSGRMFTGRASAVDQAGTRVTTPFVFGASPFFSQDISNATLGSMDFRNVRDTSQRTLLTGSAPAVLKSDGLYILQPSDKLILGVQPSLPGWNQGSGLPNNRWAKKYGIWDYENSQNGAKTLDTDLDGEPIADPMMNLEDAYEPSHGLTMLAGPSKVVLYGTFLKDNKHYPNSSTQKIRSDAVHEALHYDNPVLDQFLVTDQSEYGSSYLSSHITGSISRIGDGTAGRRGVAASVGAGDLTFSGSFQRFTRATEDSKVFYDTLLQDPFDIAAVDGRSNQTGATVNTLGSNTLVFLHQAPNAVAHTDAWLDAISVAAPNVAMTSQWADAFPFESKYSSVKKSVDRDGSKFTGPGENLWISLRSPAVNGTWFLQTPDVDYQSFIGFGPDSFNYLTTNFLSGSGDILWDGLSSDPSRSKLLGFGWQVAGISNMANTSQSTGQDDTASVSVNGSVQTNLPAATAAAARLTTATSVSEKIKSFRTLFASIVGYGRQNRKQLDFAFAGKTGIAAIEQYGPTQTTYGRSLRFHPAGLKYGYMNCDHLSPSTVHRGDRYGQFRDMLEQRLYGKTYNSGDDYNKVGLSDSPVSCIFVDADGSPIDDATKTQCLNLSTIMTSSKPYIEGEVLREIIFNSETVTIE